MNAKLNTLTNSTKFQNISIIVLNITLIAVYIIVASAIHNAVYDELYAKLDSQINGIENRADNAYVACEYFTNEIACKDFVNDRAQEQTSVVWSAHMEYAQRIGAIEALITLFILVVVIASVIVVKFVK